MVSVPISVSARLVFSIQRIHLTSVFWIPRFSRALLFASYEVLSKTPCMSRKARIEYMRESNIKIVQKNLTEYKSCQATYFRVFDITSKKCSILRGMESGFAQVFLQLPPRDIFLSPILSEFLWVIKNLWMFDYFSLLNKLHAASFITPVEYNFKVYVGGIIKLKIKLLFITGRAVSKYIMVENASEGRGRGWKYV